MSTRAEQISARTTAVSPINIVEIMKEDLMFVDQLEGLRS